ncbi:MAG: antibiotic biosynthesis monooxygenase family protein [Planctomycetota bacterium]|jgi:hypothetical protein
MRRTTLFRIAIVTTSIAVGLGLSVLLNGNTATAQEQEGQPDMGDMLISGLKQVEGCLGVDAGRYMSGKNTIVAWFENAEAAKRWYFSDTHQYMMTGMGAGEDYEHKPLSHVEDQDSPIMVIATITPTDGEQQVEGFPVPISQVSIELFAPLPGGAHVNGRFSPDSFVVPHMTDLTDESY